MRSIYIIISLTLLSNLLFGQLKTYEYPETVRKSAFYKVMISQGEDTKESFVHVSECPDGPFSAHKIWITEQDRSMSFTQFDFDGEPVQVTVTKLFGTAASNVKVTPSRYGILIDKFDGRSVTFTLDKPEYVSVHFVSDDNTDEFNNIKNGMMVFADDPEVGAPKPTDKGVSVYGPDCDFVDTEIIYFPAGEHNLFDLLPNGLIMLHDGQSLYLEGGAYVYGIVNGTASYNTRIFGRGVLSGFKHEFHYDGQRQLVEMDPYNFRTRTKRGSNQTIEGVTFLESVNHTLVVADNSLVKDVKFVAWACNNDGLRNGDNCVIDHVFMKLCDDYFYATKNALITRSVLWPMFNGATLQLGWGNNPGESGTRFLNNDIINPEWDWIGSNTGFIASQLKPDAKINNILIEDLHIDGDINALAALDYAIVEGREYGYTGKISNITFRNVEVNGSQIWWGSRGWDDYERVETELSKNYQINEEYPAQLGKSIIRGIKNADGKMATVENITFENVKINGQWITENNYHKYFDIDKETTKNIKFIRTDKNTFKEPAMPTTVAEYNRRGIGYLSGMYKSGQQCSWLQKGERLAFTVNVPTDDDFELRYSLLPVYKRAKVRISNEENSIELNLNPPTNNAYGLIKQIADQKLKLKKGNNAFQIEVLDGVVYPDALEFTPDHMEPGTPTLKVYTHWHGIIRYGESNWQMEKLHTTITPEKLNVFNGYQYHGGSDGNDTPFEITVFDSKGKEVIKTQQSKQRAEIDISKLKGGAYFYQITDGENYWTTKHFLK